MLKKHESRYVRENTSPDKAEFCTGGKWIYTVLPDGGIEAEFPVKLDIDPGSVISSPVQETRESEAADGKVTVFRWEVD